VTLINMHHRKYVKLYCCELSNKLQNVKIERDDCVSYYICVSFDLGGTRFALRSCCSFRKPRIGSQFMTVLSNHTIGRHFITVAVATR
jgi:hypothetical protein